MLKLVGNEGDCKHLYLACDGCGIEHDCVTAIGIQAVIKKFGWIRKIGYCDGSTPLVRHYCPSCQNGPKIKIPFIGEGEVHECKEG